MLRPKSPNPAREHDLVDLLLECHERIRKFVALARTAGESTDAPSDQVVDACASVERYFVEALPLHVRDEEESLVPRLSGHSRALDDALSMMESQHAEHGPQLSALLRASAAVRAAPEALALRAELVHTAEELERAFSAHLQLEETQIFPAIRTALPADVQASIIKELRARRTT
jgi:iron-sulfur cluster repair protein YtfE (RIC family)